MPPSRPPAPRCQAGHDPVPFVRANPVLGAQVNVVGTVNALEAVLARRERIEAPLVYAASAAVFGPADAETATRDEHATGHPATLYGEFKQANEGSARLLFEEHGVPSVGLRPYTVFGPGRDQEVTAAPTPAMAAAARGEAYRIPCRGRTTLNFAADVAASIVPGEPLRVRRAGRVQPAGTAGAHRRGRRGDRAGAADAARPGLTG